MTNTKCNEQKESRPGPPLNQEETWYRRLFNCNRDAGYLLTEDGKIVDVNPSACRVLGRSREVLISLNIKDVDPNFDEKSFMDFRSGSPDEEMRVFETGHVRSDGSIFPVEVTAISFTDQGKRYVYEFARDMSRHKQAEEALKQSQNDLTALVNASPESALLINPEGVILLCNATVPQRLGLGIKDMVGQSVFSYMPPEVAAVRKNHLAEVVRTGKPVQFEDRLGDRFYIHYLYPVTDGVGKVIRIAIFGQDITEFKTAEQILQGHNDLLHSVRQAQSLFISGQDPDEVYQILLNILVRHTKSEFGFLNEVLYDAEGTPYLKNLALSEIPGKNEFWQTVPPEVRHRPEFRNLNNLNGAPILEGRVIISDNVMTGPCFKGIPPGHPPLTRYMGIPLYFRNEIMGVAGVANRSERYSETLAESMKPLTEACAGMIWAGRMVRKNKETEKQVLQLQKAESLGRMAGAVAHHFNNILAAVMGNLELARMDMPSDTKTFKNLIEAGKAAQRAADMSLLMLTYLGRQQGKPKPLDLSKIARLDLEKIRPQLKKEITLKMILPPEGPIIQADPAQMEQIFKVLMTNAWEAMEKQPAGRITVSIETIEASAIKNEHRFPVDWKSPDPSFACIRIADTGKGLSDMMISGIFDPFFTDKFTGRGLGLPVALGIIKAHGGCITVESKPGEGSTFSVFLPCSSEALPRPKHHPFSKEEPEASPPPLILVIEDEDMVRNMMEDMLKQIGYAVLATDNGVKALELFKNHQTDIGLVLSDLSMPGMNGWEALAALRKIKSDLPVILASGYDQTRSMESGNGSLKPNAFLHKPFLMEELKKALNKAFSGNTDP